MSIATEIQRLQNAKNAIKTAIEAKGQTVPSTTKLDGYAALINDISTGVDTSDANAVAANIIASKTAYVNGVKVTGTMANNGATGTTLSTKNAVYTIPSGYTSGGSVGISDTEKNKIIAANIKSGITILGVSGSSSVVDTSSGTLAAAYVLSGYKGFSKGNLYTGTMVNRGTTNGSISTQGGQYTIPQGYHSGSGKVTATLPAYSGATSVTENGTLSVGGKYCPNDITVNVEGLSEDTVYAALNATVWGAPASYSVTIASGSNYAGSAVYFEYSTDDGSDWIRFNEDENYSATNLLLVEDVTQIKFAVGFSGPPSPGNTGYMSSTSLGMSISVATSGRQESPNYTLSQNITDLTFGN